MTLPVPIAPSNELRGVGPIYSEGPPPGAFGEQIGTALHGVAAQAEKIAHQEEQKAAQSQAIEAETVYQRFINDTVYDTIKGFGSKHGDDALAALPALKDLINKKRQDMQDGLGTFQAQSLFANATYRLVRFAEQHADAHAGTQRRIAQKAKYDGWIAEFQNTQAGLARGDSYDPLDLSIGLDELKQKVMDEAKSNGVADTDAVKGMIIKAASPAVSEVVSSLVADSDRVPDKLDLAKQVLSEHGWLLGPNKGGRLRIVQQAIAKRDSARMAETVWEKAPRFDATGRREISDADAMPDARFLNEQRAIAAKEPNGGAFLKRIDELWGKQQLANTKKARQIVQAIRETPGGSDAPSVQEDLGWLQRNANDYFKRLVGGEARARQVSNRLLDTEQRRRDQQSFSTVLGNLHMMEDDDVLNQNNESMADDFENTVGRPPLPAERRQLESALSRRQREATGKDPKMLSTTRQYVADAVKTLAIRDATKRGALQAKVMDSVTQAIIADQIKKDDTSVKAYIASKLDLVPSGVFGWGTQYRVEAELNAKADAAASARPAASAAQVVAPAQLGKEIVRWQTANGGKYKRPVYSDGTTGTTWELAK